MKKMSKAEIILTKILRKKYERGCVMKGEEQGDYS